MRTAGAIRHREPAPLTRLPLRRALVPGRGDAVNIALINNMPDSALLDTEQAYRDLAVAASALAGVRVHLSLFAIEGIARSDRARHMMRQRYATFEDLRSNVIDAVIVTGTEPREAELTRETFWPALTDALEWAEEHTASSLLSCLAAHAAALHFEGIRRTPLTRKCAGVFDVEKSGEHLLTKGMPPQWRAVHSRLNDVPEAALRAHGYTVLARTACAGVHLFVRQSGHLRVCFQGHPEYGGDTLLREYRRDVVRFLRREAAAYPDIPHSYFDTVSEQRLAAFRAVAERTGGIESMQGFPDGLVIRSPASTWRGAAVRVFANWLTCVGARVSRSGAHPRTASMTA